MRDFDTNGLRLAEYQAKLFEASVDDFGCSSPIFIRRFLKSNLCELLDSNESSKLTLVVSEGLEDIEDQFGESTYGKIKYSKNEMFWIGYIYRYISYTRDTSTRVIMDVIKYEQLKSMYTVYHTQSPEYVVESLLEINNLTENYFDRNWRLLQILRKNRQNNKCA